MKASLIAMAIFGFTQAAFAGWTLPPPVEGGGSTPPPPPIKILQEAAYWPPAPGTGGRPTPPPKGIQEVLLWPPAPGTGGRPTPPPKVIQISDTQEAATGVVREYHAAFNGTAEQSTMELIQGCLSNPLVEQGALSFTGIENLKFSKMPDNSGKIYAGGDCVFKTAEPEVL